MKMRSVDSVSPENLRLIILALGAGLAFFVYTGVEKKVKEIPWTPILGNVTEATGHEQESRSQDALPIVIARNTTALDRKLIFSDELIAGAFNPVEEIIEDDLEAAAEAEPEIVYSPLEILLRTYRPSISAITGRGAVINGIHYNVGEQITGLAVMVGTERQVPKLTAVSRKGAVLALGDESQTLTFVY